MDSPKAPSGRELSAKLTEGESVAVKHGISDAFSELYHEIHSSNISHMPKTVYTVYCSTDVDISKLFQVFFSAPLHLNIKFIIWL